MASSDLTMQMLLAGQQPQGQDPAVMAAMPRLQLAQQMLQGSMSDAPTSKAGIFSRLAQALVGNYALDKATTGLQSAYGNLGPDLAATLPSGHPLTAALNSPNPMVRYQATQAWQKMMPMLGGVEALRPDQTPTVGGKPIGAPPIVGNPSLGPAMAGQAGMTAGATAGATLPFDQAKTAFGGQVNAWEANQRPQPNTPAGVETIGRGGPTPMPGMVNVPGRGNQIAPAFDSTTGAPLNYSATPPPMPPGVRPGGNPLLGPIPGAGSPPPSAAPAPPPSPTAPQTSAVSPFPPEPVMSENAKQFQKLSDEATSARREIATARTLQQTLNDLGATGPATPYLARLSRYAEQAGVPAGVLKQFNLPNGATEAEASAKANELAMEIAKTMFPGRVTNVDIALAKSTKPSTEMPLAASNFLINNSIIPNAQHAVDRFGHVANMGVQGHADYSPGFSALSSKLNEFDTKNPITGYIPYLQQDAPAKAAAALRSHPDMAPDFDARYGAGSAAKILGGR